MDTTNYTESTRSKILIVIPAFNEERVIQDVIREVWNAGYNNIIVVDDCSSDKTYFKAREMQGVITLRHKINRGKGAATRTGIEAVKLMGASVIVTMDGDGQHDPKDIKNLLDPILKGKSEVSLGTRLKNTKGMPLVRIVANIASNALTWMLYRILVSDSQSGFRAYSRRAADLIETTADRYEYDSEVIKEIHDKRLSFVEVPIAVRYTDYSLGKTHKQGFVNGIKMVYKMFWNMLS